MSHHACSGEVVRPMNGTAGPAAHLAAASSRSCDLDPVNLREHGLRMLGRLVARPVKVPNTKANMREKLCKGFCGCVKYSCDLERAPYMMAVVAVLPDENNLPRLRVVSTDDSLLAHLDSTDFLAPYLKARAMSKLQTPGDREAHLLDKLGMDKLQSSSDSNTVYKVVRNCMFLLWKGRLPVDGEKFGGKTVPPEEREALLSSVSWPQQIPRSLDGNVLKKAFVGEDNKAWFRDTLVPTVMKKVKEVRLR